MTLAPTKPCSGNTPVARVKLVNGQEVTVHIPGDGTAQRVKEHSQILVRGGGQSQLPGSASKYSAVCGALDLAGGSPGGTQDKRLRKQGRSKYGIKRAK